MEHFIAVHADDLLARHGAASRFVRRPNPMVFVYDHHEVLDGIERALPLLLDGLGFVDCLCQFCGLVNRNLLLNGQQCGQPRHLSLQS